MERWIYFYDFELKPNPEEAPYMPMVQLVDMLYERQRNGESVKLLNNETAAIRINDMDIDRTNDIVFFLIQYSDTLVSDPAFSDLKTGKLRVEPKLEGEGVAVSAHMAVSLKPLEPRGFVYLSLLEEVPGVTKSKIQPFLTSEFKLGCSLVFKDDSEREKKCRAMVELAGHPSQSLVEDLERGELRGIQLVKLNLNEDEFDEKGYTKEISRNISLKVKRPYQGNEALNVIQWIKQKAQTDGYQDLRVKYKRFEGTTRKQKTIAIDTRREDIADQLYTRYEMVKVKEPLGQCLEHINDEIRLEMTKLFNQAKVG
jgi:hypothetical protein